MTKHEKIISNDCPECDKPANQACIVEGHGPRVIHIYCKGRVLLVLSQEEYDNWGNLSQEECDNLGLTK